jgi:hypothetical protein
LSEVNFLLLTSIMVADEGLFCGTFILEPSTRFSIQDLHVVGLFANHEVALLCFCARVVGPDIAEVVVVRSLIELKQSTITAYSDHIVQSILFLQLKIAGHRLIHFWNDPKDTFPEPKILAEWNQAGS